MKRSWARMSCSGSFCLKSLRWHATRRWSGEYVARRAAGSASRVATRRRVVSCFKLNPYEHLNLRFDSPVEDVKRQYRKV